MANGNGNGNGNKDKDKDLKNKWKEDTIINVWSSTKNKASLCALLLFERGLLDFDAPVVEYWPDFIENGKAFFNTITWRYFNRYRVWINGDGLRLNKTN